MIIDVELFPRRGLTPDGYQRLGAALRSLEGARHNWVRPWWAVAG